MQVIGICRFSYPAVGGFQVEHASSADRKAFLYDPTRLEARFALFEAITLPSLRGQSDADFTFLMVVGDDMPAPYQERLRDLVGDMPQVVIQPHAPGPHRRVMKRAIKSVRLPQDEPCLQFRLDDDDAVGVDFIAALKDAGTRALPLLEGHRSLAIDFNQGHVVTPTPQGIMAAPVNRQFWSPALGMLIAAGVNLSVMNFAHHKVWRSMPTLSLTGRDMMVRGYHDRNDSRQKSSTPPSTLKLLDAQGEEAFRRAYNIDAEKVRQLFGALHQPPLAVQGK